MNLRHTLLFFSSLLAGAGFLSAQPLVISCSDLVGGAVGDELRSALTDAGVTARFTFEGSLQAREDLASGRADLAIVAVPSESAETFAGEAARYPFAFQIASVAVHPDNPVREISYEQLAAVFRETEAIDDWAALADDATWSDRKISRLVARMPHTMTFELFNALVLKGEPVQRQLEFLENRNVLAGRVLDNPASIVILPWNQNADSWRYLAVKSGEAVRGFTPSNDNILFGDYSLRLPFVVVVSERLQADEVEAVMKTLYSERVSEALRKSHFIPVPDAERESLLLSLE